MCRHPDVVPAEHDHRGTQDCGIEDFLSRTLGQLGDGFGHTRHHKRTQYASA
jgi:hypothetical protein